MIRTQAKDNKDPAGQIVHPVGQLWKDIVKAEREAVYEQIPPVVNWEQKYKSLVKRLLSATPTTISHGGQTHYYLSTEEVRNIIQQNP